MVMVKRILLFLAVVIAAVVIGFGVWAGIRFKGGIVVFNQEARVKVSVAAVTSEEAATAVWRETGQPAGKILVKVVPWEQGSGGTEKLFGRQDRLIAAAQAQKWWRWQIVTLSLIPEEWIGFSAETTSKSLNNLVLQAVYHKLTGSDRVVESLSRIWVGSREVNVVSPLVFEIH